jgi:hypothetical protein
MKTNKGIQSMRCVTVSFYLLPNWLPSFTYFTTDSWWNWANHKLDRRPDTPQNNFLLWRLAWYVNFDCILFQSKGLGIINAAGVSMGLLSNAGPPSWHPAPDNIKKVCAAAGQHCKVRTTSTTSRYSLVEQHRLMGCMNEESRGDDTGWYYRVQKLLPSYFILFC